MLDSRLMSNVNIHRDHIMIIFTNSSLLCFIVSVYMLQLTNWSTCSSHAVEPLSNGHIWSQPFRLYYRGHPLLGG